MMLMLYTAGQNNIAIKKSITGKANCSIKIDVTHYAASTFYISQLRTIGLVVSCIGFGYATEIIENKWINEDER